MLRYLSIFFLSVFSVIEHNRLLFNEVYVVMNNDMTIYKTRF